MFSCSASGLSLYMSDRVSQAITIEAELREDGFRRTTRYDIDMTKFEAMYRTLLAGPKIRPRLFVDRDDAETDHFCTLGHLLWILSGGMLIDAIVESQNYEFTTETRVGA
ncbi:hypothetical protein BC832DRAFT_613304 [Gaertneriomyces semiglobifer]|nr:hypothetical protein BC832DRAFT_613304 [Gaertneriomyces semiglobifer]